MYWPDCGSHPRVFRISDLLISLGQSSKMKASVSLLLLPSQGPRTPLPVSVDILRAKLMLTTGRVISEKETLAEAPSPGNASFRPSYKQPTQVAVE